MTEPLTNLLDKYVPKTALGEKLAALRNAAIANGMPLMTAEEISEELARRRGEVELRTNGIIRRAMTDKLPPQWAIDEAQAIFGKIEFDGYTYGTAYAIAKERATRSTELEQLRRRVTAQRRELRRLNKYYGMYWNGYNRGMNAVATDTLRNKMIKAFGGKAVSEAEK